MRLALPEFSRDLLSNSAVSRPQSPYSQQILEDVLASICRIFNGHDVPGYDGVIHRIVLEKGLDSIVPLFRGIILIEGKRRRCSERVCIGLRY